MSSIESVKALLASYKFTLAGLTSLASFFYLSKRFYFDGGRCTSQARLDGKTVIITGANTGIGKQTALDLAKRGARVILACRDVGKAENAASEIRNASGNGNVLVEKLDLASMKSIREFADRVNTTENRIDILINNAGIMACPKWSTADGYEMQFGVNHLGHFLLTNLLLDKLKQSQPSRIINVSSRSYERGRIKFNDLNSNQSYDPRQVYSQSKLCNVLFTRELSKRLAGTRVTVNALHPGVVRTELGRYFVDSYGWKAIALQVILVPVMFWMFKSSKQGAQTTIYCAVDETLENVSGKYFSDCKEKEILPHGLDQADAVRLWEVSEKLCGLKP